MRKNNSKATWSRPLADLVDECVAPALAKQGFAHADLVTVWPEIVGERLAAFTEPLKLSWPRGVARLDGEGRRVPATLLLRVETGGALELQHMAATVIERINAHLGWRCVGKLAMRQGPITRPPPRHKVAPPASAAMASARQATEGIEAAELRDALTRLGARVSEAS